MTKKLFCLKLLLLLPIVISVIAINVSVDPANLFVGSKYEKGVADLLLKGSNVSNISNYDERLVQKYYVSGLSNAKDVVVLGSSRALMIRSDLFSGRSFFNNSVSGASLEDDLAIYELYRERNLTPATVILELDPWLLNRQNGQNRWKSLAGEYQAASGRFNQTRFGQLPTSAYTAQLNKLVEAISPAYFQESLKALWHHSKPGDYRATTEDEADAQIKRWDGAISYNRKERDLTVDEVRRLAISYVEQDPVYSLDKFVALDRDYENQLNAFVGSLQKDGTRVVILLAPYHPETYRRLMASQKYRIIEQVQAYFKRLAESRGVPILGSFSPADCHCDESEFYDGMHAKEVCIKKILEGSDKLIAPKRTPPSLAKVAGPE